MAPDALRKVQEKLFRNIAADGDPQQTPEKDAGLTIDIPKPPATPTPPPKFKQSEPSPKNADDPEPRSYRERLQQKLGNEYKGVERFRLDEDEKKNKHWKRWGPYLSDRQWVSRR